MAKIPEEYPVGNLDGLSQGDLIRVIEDMYRTLAVAINRKPDIIQRTTAGQPGDVFYSIGDINVKTDTGGVEMLTNFTSTTAVTWTAL